jgi:hypothetical protein
MAHFYVSTKHNPFIRDHVCKCVEAVIAHAPQKSKKIPVPNADAVRNKLILILLELFFDAQSKRAPCSRFNMFEDTTE